MPTQAPEKPATQRPPRKDGKPPHTRTTSPGFGKPVKERTRDEIYNVARALRIHGRGHMSRKELIKACEDWLVAHGKTWDQV